ncbi:HTH_Hin protein [Vibrio phage VPMS1]|uniref:HTH_Hin protein n=1 Tax=Vibrio phage VPMS1 TaxID=1233488 RepID=UPI0003584AB0|nr:HTH_Hin protein [Vibrio phage VPMS1]AFV51125.1 HTH_Hin protein [Vibrio phage VPMS1]
MQEQILRAWEVGYFTDSEICASLSCTHIDIREALVSKRKQPGPQLTIECRRELQMMYDHGETDATAEDVKNLVDRLASSESIIYNSLKGDFQDYTPRLTRNDLIRKDLANGLPQEEVAQRHGVSQSLVSKLNPNPKCSRKRGKKLTPDEWQELVSQYPRFTVTELAKMYGVGRATIYRRLEK